MASSLAVTRFKLKISCQGEALVLCQPGLSGVSSAPVQQELPGAPFIDSQLNWELFLLSNIIFFFFPFHLFPQLKGGWSRWEVGRGFADSLHVRVALFDLVRAYLIVKRDLFVFCDRGFVYNVVLERKLI